MTFLKHLITTPVFEDEIKTQRAYVLHIIVWALIFVPIPFVLYTIAMVPQNRTRTLRLANPSEMVPFSDIIHEAMERVHDRLDAANVQVKLQKEYPVVYDDKQRLIEIMQNLLDKAAKFSKARPIALIEIGTLGTDHMGNVIFFVRDNGIGIDPKFHERIFGLFNKLNPGIDGTGIGLTLVKRTVEIHGGRLWVESEFDQGATSYFTLPDKKE